MLMSFTWLTNDLLKDDPPSKFQLSKIACSVQSTKTLENPRNLGIVRACADKSLLCFFLDRPELLLLLYHHHHHYILSFSAQRLLTT